MGRGAKLFIRVVTVLFVVWVLAMGTLFYMFSKRDNAIPNRFTPPWLEIQLEACRYESVACASYLIGYFYTNPGYQHPDAEKRTLKDAVFKACLSETPYLCQIAINTHYGLLLANEQMQYLAAACRSGDVSACETTGPQKQPWWATYLRKAVVFFYRIYSWLTSRNWLDISFTECSKGFGPACAAHMRALWFTDRAKLVFENPKIPIVLEQGCTSGKDSLCKFLFGLIESQRSPELEIKLYTEACQAGDLQACGEAKSLAPQKK